VGGLGCTAQWDAKRRPIVLHASNRVGRPGTDGDAGSGTVAADTSDTADTAAHFCAAQAGALNELLRPQSVYGEDRMDRTAAAASAAPLSCEVGGSWRGGDAVRYDLLADVHGAESCAATAAALAVAFRAWQATRAHPTAGTATTDASPTTTAEPGAVVADAYTVTHQLLEENAACRVADSSQRKLFSGELSLDQCAQVVWHDPFCGNGFFGAASIGWYCVAAEVAGGCETKRSSQFDAYTVSAVKVKAGAEEVGDDSPAGQASGSPATFACISKQYMQLNVEPTACDATVADLNQMLVQFKAGGFAPPQPAGNQLIWTGELISTRVLPASGDRWPAIKWAAVMGALGTVAEPLDASGAAWGAALAAGAGEGTIFVIDGGGAVGVGTTAALAEAAGAAAVIVIQRAANGTDTDTDTDTGTGAAGWDVTIPVYWVDSEPGARLADAVATNPRTTLIDLGMMAPVFRAAAGYPAELGANTTGTNVTGAGGAGVGGAMPRCEGKYEDGPAAAMATVRCAGAACSADECCVRKPLTCADTDGDGSPRPFFPRAGCPAGWWREAGAALLASRGCPQSGCTFAECCVQNDDCAVGFRDVDLKQCKAGRNHLVAAPEQTRCADRECTRADCCAPNPTCEAAAFSQASCTAAAAAGEARWIHADLSNIICAGLVKELQKLQTFLFVCFLLVCLLVWLFVWLIVVF
jgi:hypothetical protein